MKNVNTQYGAHHGIRYAMFSASDIKVNLNITSDALYEP